MYAISPRSNFFKVRKIFAIDANSAPLARTFIALHTSISFNLFSHFLQTQMACPTRIALEHFLICSHPQHLHNFISTSKTFSFYISFVFLYLEFSCNYLDCNNSNDNNSNTHHAEPRYFFCDYFALYFSFAA